MNKFNYFQPKSFNEAGEKLISMREAAIPFAGGTDVLGLIKNNVFNIENLVNLKSTGQFNKIIYIPGKGLEIGSLVKINEIAEHPMVNKKFTVLAEAAGEVATPQLRNVGTIGGNICQRPRCFYFRGDFHCLRKGGDFCYAFDGQNKFHCIVGGGPCYIVHPSDTAVALMALNAKISIFSNNNVRVIPISEFFILPEKDHTKENILKQGEIVEKIIIPDLPEETKSKYIKIKERAVWDFAVVSIAAVINKSGEKISDGKIVYGGVAPIPWIEKKVNSKLSGLKIGRDSFETVSKIAFSDSSPLEKNKYKVPLAKNLTRRILDELT